ncbi:MAG: TIGR01212 family radical SAM protein [Hespellia sp.]|nr:TIGR01212 family radical SAM protein [Hespellia sp.]
MKRWGEKRYYSLDYYCKSTYGEKLYKVTLNGGMTCPNRDGNIGTGGCIFCSASGSGDFAGSASLSIPKQLQDGKQQLRQKRPIASFIAYFQAFTNTYGSIEHLRAVYSDAIADPEVKILSIATRPDCLGDDVLALLDEMNQSKPVWVELGLQTIHEESARYIRRGYMLPVFEKAVADLRKLGISVIVHVILGLPGESREMIFETIDYLNHRDIQGIKLQMLHVLKDTDLALNYSKDPFWIPTMQEYVELVCDCISHLREDIVIHRITGDGPKDLLIAPEWSSRKRTVLNAISTRLKEMDLWQSKYESR